MRKLSNEALVNVNGGGAKKIWDEFCYFVNEAIPSFINGAKKGWKDAWAD